MKLIEILPGLVTRTSGLCMQCSLRYIESGYSQSSKMFVRDSDRQHAQVKSRFGPASGSNVSDGMSFN